MRTTALVISVLLHPLLMATYTCLLLFFGIHDTVYDFLTPFDNKLRITFVVFMFSFVFPVVNILVLYKLKRIPSITLSEQKDRTYPYIVTALFYFGLFYLLMDVNIWPSIKLFIIGGGLAILLTALVNLKYKISAHMVGLGGLLGILISVSYLIKFNMTPYYVAVIVAAGITGTARLVLNEHRPAQLYLGFLMGLVIQTGLFFSFQTFTFA